MGWCRLSLPTRAPDSNTPMSGSIRSPLHVNRGTGLSINRTNREITVLSISSLERRRPGRAVRGIVGRAHFLMVYSDGASNLLIHLGANFAVWSEIPLKSLRIWADFDSTIPTRPGAGSLFELIARIGCCVSWI